MVTVDIPLDNLEINQCPQPFSIANAFKNTARCHSRSTKVSILAIMAIDNRRRIFLLPGFIETSFIF